MASSHSMYLSERLLRLDLRAAALVCAIVFYAFAGSPTPDMPGLIEAFIGGLLVFAIGVSGFFGALSFDRYQSYWFFAGQAFLIYGVISGLLGGLLFGADLPHVIRDLLPFGFLFLPLFLMRFYHGEVGSDRVFFLFAFIGVIFALRTDVHGLLLPFKLDSDALYYLGNSPSVLFAALFLSCCALQRLAASFGLKNCGAAFVFLGLGVFAFLPIVETIQRASLLAFAVYFVFAAAILFFRSPIRMSVVVVVLLCLFAVFAGGILDMMFGDFLSKTQLVGANMRVQELEAVLVEISAHPLSFLFGKGWGASFSSPAVADIEVYFTHSLLTSVLLKTGFIGFALCIFYIGTLFIALIREFKVQPLIVMAIAAPLLIDVFLYAAYKSLEFGLLLALIPYVANRSKYSDNEM